MAERIDKLIYQESDLSSTREGIETNLFLTQPAEYLVTVIKESFASSPVWSRLFGDQIADYERMDFSMRALPSMRIYIEQYRKDFESWFINGSVKIDVAWPPSIRRVETQQLPMTICGAILQQFRSQTFFQTIISKVPGLNELGKTVDVDLALSLKFDQDILPLSQVTINYRIDLREWDEYIESDNRTKNLPFDRPLADLERIVTTIEGLRTNDPDSIEVSLGIDQDIEE